MLLNFLINKRVLSHYFLHHKLDLLEPLLPHLELARLDSGQDELALEVLQVELAVRRVVFNADQVVLDSADTGHAINELLRVLLDVK